MRILFTTDVYAPHLLGGTEAVVQRLAEHLAAKGHEVVVATLDADGCPGATVLNGVRVLRLQAKDLTRRMGFQATFSANWPGWIRGVIHRTQPDVINAHNLLFFTTTPTLLAARRTVPTVLTIQVHGLDAVGGAVGRLASAYERTYGRLAIHLASHVVCVGEAVARYFQTIAGSSRPMTVIRNGVDPRQFAPPARRPGAVTALFAGRLVANKGPQVFVEAARHVLSRRQDVGFWLAGDGPLAASLIRQATPCPVKFLGPRTDMSELMKRASIFVRTSTSEGLSLAVLEAMASGLAVVASDIPGNRELIREGETGLLVAPGDALGTARVIEHLADHPRERWRLGRNARRAAQRSTTWDSAASQLEALFASLVNFQHSKLVVAEHKLETSSAG